MAHVAEIANTALLTEEDKADIKTALKDVRQDSWLGIFLNQLLEAPDASIFLSSRELTPNEVAEILHVSRPYVRKLMDRNLLRYHKVGSQFRVSSDDLVDYIKRTKTATQNYAQSLARHDEERRRAYREASPLTQDEKNELDDLFNLD